MNAIISDLTIRAGGGKKQSKGTKKTMDFYPFLRILAKEPLQISRFLVH